MEERSERIASALEAQLTKCDTVLAACLADVPVDEILSEFRFKRVLGLMKMSTQLANAIAKADGQASKNREKRGSIPQ